MTGLTLTVSQKQDGPGFKERNGAQARGKMGMGYTIPCRSKLITM